MATLNSIEKKIENIVDILERREVNNISGTLPLTFRSNGSALINYRIYGTAEGAGERTKNILDIVSLSGTSGNVEIVTDKSKGTYTLNGVSDSPKFPVVAHNVTLKAGTSYILSGCPTGAGQNTFKLYTVMGGVYYTDVGEGVTIPAQENDTTIDFAMAFYQGVTFDNMVIKPMLRPVDTSDTFIPYGYQIPLTVSQQGQTDKNYDIYIGDSKLLSADYIDYESRKIVRNGTPQDPPLPLPKLETFNGTNTLDSTETLGDVTIKGHIKNI